MKHITILIILLSVFTSCKKIGQEPYSVIGNWEKYKQITIDNGEETEKVYNSPEELNIYEDGTYDLGPNSSNGLEWSLNDNVLILHNTVTTIEWLDKYEWTYTYTNGSNWSNTIYIQKK